MKPGCRLKAPPEKCPVCGAERWFIDLPSSDRVIFECGNQFIKVNQAMYGGGYTWEREATCADAYDLAIARAKEIDDLLQKLAALEAVINTQNI
jgi:hypothetical protein